MIVCVCQGVNDKTIERCAEAGAETVAQVARACRAGTHCGTCHQDIRELLERYHARRAARSAPALAAK